MIKSFLIGSLVLCCGITLADEQKSVLTQKKTQYQEPTEVQQQPPEFDQQPLEQQQPQYQQPVPQYQQAPALQYARVQSPASGPVPVWILKKKHIGPNYRAKPAWMHPPRQITVQYAPQIVPQVVLPQVVAPQTVAPQVVAPQVVAPQVVIPSYSLPTYYYQLPQPTVIYRPEVVWR